MEKCNFWKQKNKNLLCWQGLVLLDWSWQVRACPNHDFWSNSARFGFRIRFLTKFLNDSAWLCVEKRKTLLALGFEVSGMCRLAASGIRRVGHFGIYEVGLRGFGYLCVLDLTIWEAGNSEICRLPLGILLRAWEFGIRSFWEFGSLQ